MKHKRELSEAQKRVLAENAWRPGESGNPLGGSRFVRMRSQYMHLLGQRYPGDRKRTWAEAIVRSLFEAAVDRDIASIREISNRVDGLPTQRLTLRHTGEPSAYVPGLGEVRLSDMAPVPPQDIISFLRAGAARQQYPIRVNPATVLNGPEDMERWLDNCESTLNGEKP